MVGVEHICVECGNNKFDQLPDKNSCQKFLTVLCDTTTKQFLTAVKLSNTPSEFVGNL